MKKLPRMSNAFLKPQVVDDSTARLADILCGPYLNPNFTSPLQRTHFQYREGLQFKASHGRLCKVCLGGLKRIDSIVYS